MPSVQKPRTPLEPETQATPLKSTSTECVEPPPPVRETSEARGVGYTNGCSGSRMSVTETGEALAGVGAPCVPPTDHMKRQSFRHVEVWPWKFLAKVRTFGVHGSLRSTMIWPFWPVSRDMKASLRRLSTVMFSPSQNCVMVGPSGMTGTVFVASAGSGFVAFLRSSSVTWPIHFGLAGSFSDQTER